jgi:actin-related protein 6
MLTITNSYNVHLQGLLTSWNPENLIFNDIFTRFPNFDATTTSLLITEPYLNPPALGENYDQMVFEEWEFASYARSCGESSVWLGSG